MAQSLVQIVLFRILQGLFGAALVPLSQTVLMNINSKERQGSAIALWGVAVMAGPVLGPVLGGWLTQAFSWRYVFYINVPVGILAFLGMMTFLSDTARNATAKLDWFGFGTLSLAIAAMQVLLDRGQSLIGSVPARSSLPRRIIAGSALRTCSSSTPSPRDDPFVGLSLFRDPNYTAGRSVHRHCRPHLPTPRWRCNLPICRNPHELPDRRAGLACYGTSGRWHHGLSMLVVGRLTGRVDTRLLSDPGVSVLTCLVDSM